jgi:hypothetical protein
MAKFVIVIREFKEHEFVREMADEQTAHRWADAVIREEGCDLDGYEVSVRRLPEGTET